MGAVSLGDLAVTSPNLVLGNNYSHRWPPSRTPNPPNLDHGLSVGRLQCISSQQRCARRRRQQLAAPLRGRRHWSLSRCLRTGIALLRRHAYHPPGPAASGGPRRKLGLLAAGSGQRERHSLSSRHHRTLTCTMQAPKQHLSGRREAGAVTS